MHLMRKTLWAIVNNTKLEPTQPTKLIVLKNIDKNAKSIIGLELSNLELHHINLDESSKEIWDKL